MLATGWKSLEQLQLLLPHDLLLVSKSKKTLKFASNQFTLEGLSHALHVVRETDVEIEAMCDSNNSCLRCEFSNGAGNYKLCPWKNSSRSLRSAPPPNHPLDTQSILLCLQWVTNPESETRKLNDNFIANQDKIVITFSCCNKSMWSMINEEINFQSVDKKTILLLILSKQSWLKSVQICSSHLSCCRWEADQLKYGDGVAQVQELLHSPTGDYFHYDWLSQ